MTDFTHITPEWVTTQMLDFNIKNPRQLSIFSGVRYESLTMSLSGKREMSGEIKKTLYWFFKFKYLENQFKEFCDKLESLTKVKTMQIIKYKLEGPIEDFTVLSSVKEFEGDALGCEIKMKRLKNECQKFYGIAHWKDGFVCENGSGRAEISYDICD
jgi:hypothetical protein